MKRFLVIPLELIAFAVAVQSASGQDPPPLPVLPDSVANRVLEVHNAPGTIRLSGDAVIAAGTRLEGDVAAVHGAIAVSGIIDGTLVVINGDLLLEPGASISGDVLVVGGQVSGQEAATIGGNLTHFPEPLAYRTNQDGTLTVAERVEDVLTAGRDFPFGRTDLLLAARSGYNRVEGLPIQFGPRIRLGRSNPTYLDGFIIYRTATDLDDLAVDRLGYGARIEQAVGGRDAVRIGARVFSEIVPIERHGLSDRENSFATFLLHRDYRDSYEADGWAAYVRFARPGGASDLRIEYIDERHRAAAPADPWSILRGDEAWRPNPIVAEGELRSVRVHFEYDTRNEEIDPSAGWDISLMLEQGVGGDLFAPADIVADPPDPFSTQDRERFTAATVDVRRYARLAPYAWAALRLYAAGSVDGAALPPQRQRALGGEGTMPAFDLFQFDCAARATRVGLRGRDFFPHYGCDRAVLLQLEYQAGFPFLRRFGRSLGLPIDLGQQVRWSAFFDVGHAWNESGSLDGRGRGQPDFAADLGLGVRIGPLGFYWAVPLTEEGSGVNFFMRLGRRL
jgi:hypothetical protein